MTSMIERLFLDHPRSVDETYLEHQAFALGFAIKLIGAGLAALVHSILPFAFETTASRMVGEMAERLEKRRLNA